MIFQNIKVRIFYFSAVQFLDIFFFLSKKRTKILAPEKFPKSACNEYGNIRRNFIAYGSKENSRVMLPLRNEIKWAYLTLDTGLKINLYSQSS